MKLVSKSQEEDIEIFDTHDLLLNQTAADTNESDQLVQNDANAETRSTTSTRTRKSDISHAKTLLILISNQLSLIRMRYKEKDIQLKNKNDWGLIACTFDRLCLIIYVVLMFLGLFIIFI